jgi:hypothetical protein
MEFKGFGLIYFYQRKESEINSCEEKQYEDLGNNSFEERNGVDMIDLLNVESSES